MKVVGYTDRLSAAPGDTIQFKVSCQADFYHANIVRLHHGDLNPAGPGLRTTPVPSPTDGEYRGRHQAIHVGSYALVEGAEPIASLDSFSVTGWVLPTIHGLGERGLLTQWSIDGLGFGVFVTDDGDLAVRLGDGTSDDYVRTHQPLALGAWHFFAVVVDRPRGVVRIHQIPAVEWPVGGSRVVAEEEVRSGSSDRSGIPFLMGASHMREDAGIRHAVGCFNGKLGRPRLFGRPLTADEVLDLRRDVGTVELESALVAAWDFARDIDTDRVSDLSDSGLHGKTFNMPSRGVTGHNWTGREIDFRNALAEYDAIYFHDDDLEDANWASDFELEIPDTWQSGIYAARLSVDDFEDYIPFVVTPPRGEATARVALLLPTLTYQAYGNEHMFGDYITPLHPDYASALDGVLEHGTDYEKAVFRYIIDSRLNSIYDLHTDGTGVCYATRLRPISNMRPRYNKPGLQFRHPHGLSCDLYTVDWLEAMGYDFDVITDENLHEQGQELLDQYSVVLTGSHPEYWTWEMLSGLRGYLAGGGRIMYLGGNGLYWVTSLGRQNPHVLEVRRGYAGTRAWSSPPGEGHHSTTGEIGGLWRHRGLPPQATVGIGISALLGHWDPGVPNAVPYVRTDVSNDPRAAFIFDGVHDEVIGDFGLHLGAAAGYELDSASFQLGTPPHALVIATAAAGGRYLPVVEDLRSLGRDLDDANAHKVKSDMVYFEGPAGGAVFSVGSISWCGSLSHNQHMNPISRITANVLKEFARQHPEPGSIE